MGKKTGARIKEARTAAKLTQEQLAKSIPDITAADISKAERGETELTQAVLKQIAKLTGVTQASLLNAEKADDNSKTAAGKTASAKAEGKPVTKAEGKPVAKAESKPAAKSSGKTKSPAASPSSASAKRQETELTATEKKLVELYRAADSETKKAAMSLLKGETSDLQKILTSLLGDSLAKFLK